MGKKTYIGVDSVARKAKKAYIGVDNVARKIKKMYIGDADGKARLFFSGSPEIKYYGTVDDLNSVRGDHVGISLKGWAIFTAGRSSSSSWSNGSDVYDDSLTHAYISNGFNYIYSASATVGDYGLVAGGNYTYNFSDGYETSDIWYINTSLTTGKAKTSMYSASMFLAGASVGDYALFAGGKYYNNSSEAYIKLDKVNAINSSLTSNTIKYLSTARDSLMGASVGNYAIFAGGESSRISDTVDAFNSSLTKSNPAVLSIGRYNGVGVNVGDYALFAGGYSSSHERSAVVDAYNTSLTRSTITSLAVATMNSGATSLQNKYAIIAGGTVSMAGTESVSIYDESLTRTTSALSFRRPTVGASTTNNAIFGGGTYGSVYYKYADAFTLED